MHLYLLEPTYVHSTYDVDEHPDFEKNDCFLNACDTNWTHLGHVQNHLLPYDALDCSDGIDDYLMNGDFGRDDDGDFLLD